QHVLPRHREKKLFLLREAQAPRGVGQTRVRGEEVAEAFETGDEACLRGCFQSSAGEAHKKPLQQRLVDNANFDVPFSLWFKMIDQFAQVAPIGGDGVRRRGAFSAQVVKEVG